MTRLMSEFVRKRPTRANVSTRSQGVQSNQKTGIKGDMKPAQSCYFDSHFRSVQECGNGIYSVGSDGPSRLLGGCFVGGGGRLLSRCQNGCNLRTYKLGRRQRRGGRRMIGPKVRIITEFDCERRDVGEFIDVQLE